MNIFQRVIVEPIESFSNKVLDFLPNFLTSLLILVVGIIIGLLLKMIFSKILKALHLDRILERMGTVEILRKGGIKDAASDLLGRLIGWLTIILFAIFSVRALQAPAVERLLEQFLLYLPNIFVAIVILFLGYLLSNFLGRAALIAAVNAGMKISGIIGKFVKFTVFILSATMALEQLGIGKETVVIAFAIIFGGIVLSLAISFGLGGRDIAKEYIEKELKGEDNKDEISHL